MRVLFMEKNEMHTGKMQYSPMRIFSAAKCCYLDG